jgi:peptide/nickel transport system substrate-binding protein
MRYTQRPAGLLLGILALLALAAIACAGSTETVAQSPQEPAAAAQPAPAAPAADPQAATGASRVDVSVGTATQGAPDAMMAAPQYGDILTFANRRDPPAGWDSHRTTTVNLGHINGGLSGNGNLVRPCRATDFEVCPSVAESWEHNSDFTQWTFKIRDDITWHDGKPFTAQDAKFWFDLVVFGTEGGGKTRGPANFRGSFSDVTSIEVVAGNKLQINLGLPEPFYLLKIFASNYNISHPPHLMQPFIDGGQATVSFQDVDFVGIGAFKMKDYTKGVRAQVRRNDAYWEKDEKGNQLPYLDGIDFVMLPDKIAMDAAFRVGRIDGGARGSGHTLTQERQAGYIDDLGDQVYFIHVPATSAGLVLNTISPGPLQDVRVRKAMALWVDKQEVFPAFQGGFGKEFTILLPGNPFVNPDFLTWPGWDPATKPAARAEAKRLLAEAGYGPGDAKVQHLCRRAWLQKCEYYSAQLQDLGVDFGFDSVDDPTWVAKRLTLEYGTFESAASQWVIPESLEVSMTRWSLGKPGISRHEDQKVVDYFDEMRVATSLEERTKIYREMEKYYLLEQVYFIPLGGDIAVIPYRSFVHGVIPSKMTHQNYTDFATVWSSRK